MRFYCATAPEWQDGLLTNQIRQLFRQVGDCGRKKTRLVLSKEGSLRVIQKQSYRVEPMSRISPLLWATAVILTAATSVSGMPSGASSISDAGTPDSSFSIFFDPGAASISKEGREIISLVAKQFAAAHGRQAAARVVVTSESDSQENPSLLNQRVKAVGRQLVRDGIPGKYVSAIERPNAQVEPLSLRQWQQRRVSISIHENRVIARL
jgi:hypothetical protein